MFGSYRYIYSSEGLINLNWEWSYLSVKPLESYSCSSLNLEALDL
jgi:hypothetical protein